jgi:hypothetical protein
MAASCTSPCSENYSGGKKVFASGHTNISVGGIKIPLQQRGIIGALGITVLALQV